MLKNQKGFTAFEAVIIIVALAAIGAAGYFAYQARQDKTDYSVNVPKKSASKTTPDTASKPATNAVSDATLIEQAVKSQDQSGSANLIVKVTSIVGDNAIGTTSSADGPGGAEFIAHKSGGNWSVVYEGQQKPGNELGQKYNLPSDWYSTDY